jgi:hypothetical protein
VEISNVRINSSVIPPFAKPEKDIFSARDEREIKFDKRPLSKQANRFELVTLELILAGVTPQITAKGVHAGVSQHFSFFLPSFSRISLSTFIFVSILIIPFRSQ